MRAGGCLLILAIIGVISVELWFALQIPEWIDPSNPTQHILTSILGACALTVVGVQLARWRMRRFSLAMMSGSPGPAVAAILGAILIALPGYLTAIPGLLLQLPPIQKLFGRFAAALMTVLMQRAAKRMGMPPGAMGGMGGMGPFGAGMGGGMGPMPGGNPFAGMKPSSGAGPAADQRLRGGKVVDTTAQRVEKD